MIEVRKTFVNPIDERADSRHYHRMKIKELRDGYEELVTKLLIKSNGIKGVFKLKSDEYALLQELLEYADKAANYVEVLGADCDQVMNSLMDMRKELAESKEREEKILKMLEEIQAKQNEEKKA
jgi:hypothetical protein